MTDFPQYRKYVGVDTWFKIESANQFTEIKRVGEKLVRTVVKAEQFPELNFIQDMLGCKENRWVKIQQKDFESL